MRAQRGLLAGSIPSIEVKLQSGGQTASRWLANWRCRRTGEPLSLDEVIALTSYEALTDDEERGMIVVSQASCEPEVRLAHPHYGEVLREGLPVLRGRELRLRLAETIQRRQPVSPDDALRAARWLIDAGADVPSVLLVDAAAAAHLAGDPALGAELASRALDGGRGSTRHCCWRGAHTIRNRFEDAEAVLAAGEGAAPGHPAAREYLAQPSRRHSLEAVYVYALMSRGRAKEAHAASRREQRRTRATHSLGGGDPGEVVVVGEQTGLELFRGCQDDRVRQAQAIVRGS